MALPSRLHDNSANLLVELVDLHSPRRWTEDEITLVEQVTDQLTLALENAQLFRQTQTQAEELNLLRQISLELARQQYDLRSVIEIIIRRATELLDSDAGAIWLWNEAESQLKLHSAYSARGFCGNLSKLEFRDESHRMAFQNRKTQVLDGYRLWEKAAHLPGDPPIVPAMVAPLIWQTRGIGVLLIARNQPAHPYTPNEQHLFELLAAQAAAVIQNATLFDQTQKALEETDLLYKASAEINASLSYDEILNVLRSYTILGDQSRAVTINLYDRPWSADAPPEWYDIIAQWSLDGDAEQEPVRYALSTIPFADQLLCASSPTIIEDIASDTRWSANQRHVFTEYSQARGLITAPLVTAGQGIGHITAFYPRPINVAETAIRRLTTLAGQAAIAIQNMRLLDETRRRADELQTAAEIARDTSGTLSLEILLSRTAEMIRERFGYYHTAIFLTDEKEDYAYRSISTNPGTKGLRQHPIKIQVGSYSVVGYVTRVGEPYLVNDVTQDPFYQVDPLLPETRAEVGIPLKIGNRVIGALDVQSSRVNAFTPNDISVLQILADQIAVAVENARSYQLSLEAVEEMRKADQLKSQFLANMSHELRTPLNSIIGFSRVILKGIDGPISETQEQDLLAIHGSGQHLLSLINDILDLSKIEAGKMELSLVDQVQVADLVHSILSTASGLVKDKPIEIICEIAPKLPPVKADPLKIRQVLLNLISNAAKFTDEGSITIKAEKITGKSGDAYIQVSVSDTGQGISSEDQKKLFLPFSQVDASPTRKTGGSGLGLSICRHLIEMHHGQIGVHSQVGLGSTFYFTLPISNPSAPE
jgi:signal transduction histidine kinase